MICIARPPASGMDRAELIGRLCIPPGACGLVVYARVAESRRRMASYGSVLRGLRTAGLATLAVDLVSPCEGVVGKPVSDIDLLTERLEATLAFLMLHRETESFPLGVIGDGIVAAAVLTIAAERPDLLCAAISCCGRPDLARVDFSRIAAPTLLVVPGRDRHLMSLNERVFCRLDCTSQLAVIRDEELPLTQQSPCEAYRRVIRQWCRRYVNSSTLGRG